MGHSAMGHRRHQQNVDRATSGRRPDGPPLFHVSLLHVPLAPVELPVLVDGDRLSAVDQTLDVRDKGFASGDYVFANVLAAVGSVVQVLHSC